MGCITLCYSNQSDQILIDSSTEFDFWSNHSHIYYVCATHNNTLIFNDWFRFSNLSLRRWAFSQCGCYNSKKSAIHWDMNKCVVDFCTEMSSVYSLIHALSTTLHDQLHILNSHWITVAQSRKITKQIINFKMKEIARKQMPVILFYFIFFSQWKQRCKRLQMHAR